MITANRRASATIAFFIPRCLAIFMAQAFSNRPFGVKRFQAIHHHCGVDVAHGLVLLFGIGTKALPSWDPKTRWNNLWGDLAVGRSERTCELTSSIVPQGTSFHHSVELEVFSYRV